MKEKLELILKNATQEINNAKLLQDLENVKLNYLSRKGEHMIYFIADTHFNQAFDQK